MAALSRKLIYLQLFAFGIGLCLLFTASLFKPDSLSAPFIVIGLLALCIVCIAGIASLLIVSKNAQRHTAAAIASAAGDTENSTLTDSAQVLALTETGRTDTNQLRLSDNQLTTRLAAQQRELDIAKETALQANRMKSKILEKASHEALTPLNSILGFAECLQDAQLDRAQQQQFAKRIRDNAIHLTAMVNDLMLFSSRNTTAVPLNYRDVDIYDLLHSVAVSFAADAESNGLEMINDYDAVYGITMQTDPVRLREIANNLVSNGIRHTSHGHIKISAKIVRDTHEDSLLISVEDSGCGIDSDRINTIFHERISGNEGPPDTVQLGLGLGLGLAIVSDITYQMGAAIDVSSAIGKGSTFSLTVPMRDVYSEKTLPPIAIDKKKRVLIITAYPPSAETLAARLARHSVEVELIHAEQLYQTEQLYQAEQLLHAKQRQKDTRENIDYILLDIRVSENHQKGNSATERNALEHSTTNARRRTEELVAKIRAHENFTDTPITILLPSASRVSIDKTIINVSTCYKPAEIERLFAQNEQTATVESTANGVTRKENSPLRILLADDNKGNIALLDHHLTGMGHTADIFYHGDDAIYAVNNKPYELIILDIRMQPTDGVDVLRAARSSKTNANTRIIACTAHTSSKEFRRLMAAGFDQVIHKPVLKEDIKQLLEATATASAPAFSPEPQTQHHGEHPAQRSSTDRTFFDVSAALDRAGGSSKVAKKIFVMFADEISKALNEAKQISDSSNHAHEKQIELVHQINGASALTGALALKSMADSVEDLLKSDEPSDWPQAEKAYRSLIDYLHNLDNWIQQQDIERIFE